MVQVLRVARLLCATHSVLSRVFVLPTLPPWLLGRMCRFLDGEGDEGFAGEGTPSQLRDAWNSRLHKLSSSGHRHRSGTEGDDTSRSVMAQKTGAPMRASGQNHLDFLRPGFEKRLPEAISGCDSCACAKKKSGHVCAKLRRSAQPDLGLKWLWSARWVELDHIGECAASHLVESSLGTRRGPPRQRKNTCERTVPNTFGRTFQSLHGQTAQSINLVRVQCSPKGPLAVRTL